MSEIREGIGDKKIWISIYKTRDKKGRYVANLIVGTREEKCKIIFN
jgi:hypothetical protein